MPAVDSSVWIDYFAHRDNKETSMLNHAIRHDKIFMPPIVLSEILSDPEFPGPNINLLYDAILLDPKNGYWERAGLMRASLLVKKYKPKLPDTLIAQSCIDYDVPLLTRDSGFAMFEKHAGLKLVKSG